MRAEQVGKGAWQAVSRVWVKVFADLEAEKKDMEFWKEMISNVFHRTTLCSALPEGVD